MSRKLYEIEIDLADIYEMLNNPEYSDYEEAIKTTLEGLEYEAEEKALAYAKVIKNEEYSISQLEGQIEFLKAELDKKKKIKSTRDRGVEYLKNKVLDVLDLMDKKKIESDEFVISKRKSQKLEILDENEALQSEYIRAKIEIDKAKIKEVIKGGKELSFAEIRDNYSLNIR